MLYVDDFSLESAADTPGQDVSSYSIAVEGVEKRFAVKRGPTLHALGPVDMSIRPGEFVCLVGPSGCGKSTLLRAIAGLTRPSAGRIRVAVSQGKRVPIAMVFQQYGIYPWKTVGANVRFGLEVSGVPRREADKRVDLWLERMGLSGFAKQYPAALSGGMQQRVAIARAMAVEPEILLMDEPFAALDAQLREVMQEELLAICQAERRTVLFVTHSLEEALVLGDRVFVMSARPGRLIRSVEVPFGRPRTGGVRASADFGALRAQLWESLRGEVADEVVHE